MSDKNNTVFEKIIKSNGNTLNLRNCGLTQIPDEIFKLTNLTQLNLSKNQITDISTLSKLTNLTQLNLSKNQITDISTLSKLTNLKELSLFKNKITDISILSKLTNLEILNLAKNKIIDISVLSKLTNLIGLSLSRNEIIDISVLSKLTNLTGLSLSRNDITDISALSKLKNLTRLGISNCQLIDISTLSELTNLAVTNLSQNNITDISALSKLANLRELDISNNTITDISTLSKLTNLAVLNLSQNQITDISALSKLADLKGLSLASNKITDISALLELIKNNINIKFIKRFAVVRNSINILNNQLQNPPNNIVEQGREAVLTYFKDLEEQGIGKLNEAKLIIVGEPDAGKTTLMNKLLDPKYDLASNKTDSTLGIAVKKWCFTHAERENREFSVNIWDFGGQQIQYMTHQFFLTPDAVYILVSANDRKEPTNFPYWFKIIHLLGEVEGRYSPILVVLNAKDKRFINKFNFDRKFYEERYPELKIMVREVDLNLNDANYDSLCQTIEELLIKLPHVNDNRPARWDAIREELIREATKHNYINFERYAEICRQFDVIHEDSQKVLSGYLHSIGSLLHFVEDISLRDFIILNPQWAVDAVYSVLIDNEISLANGYFTKNKLDAVWNKYTIYERQNLLNLMKKENFEICYELVDDTNTLVAPQLLMTERPEYSWNNTNTLKFRFRYKFMPEGIITRLIVRLNTLVYNKLVWNKGVILEDNNCKALVLEEENIDGLKVLDIAISGDIQKRKYLLHSIREEIKKIHLKWFKNIKFEQMIPCNCDICIKDSKPTYFEYSELEQYQYEGQENIKCKNGKIKDVEVLSMLEGIFTNEELQSSTEGNINIFITKGDTVGSKMEITGNAKIGNAIITKSIKNSSIVTSQVNSDNDLGALLEILKQESLKVSEKLDADKRADFMSDVELLTNEAVKETPSKKYLNMSVQGILDATKTVGEVGNVLLEILPKIGQYLLP